MNIHLLSESATLSLGAALFHALEPGATLYLEGDLGAGKTALIRGLLREAGVEGAIKSPTYALVESYALKNFRFHHFDFYRMRDPSEFEDAGLSEYFTRDAVCAVEWPDKAAGYVPAADCVIALSATEYDENARDASLKACTPLGERMLEQMSKSTEGFTTNNTNNAN
jgi:tRNA threonylcarbamoyladenosine biosynthesis protein TsaE